MPPPDATRDPACEECGYSLRGTPKPPCPECGTRFDPIRPWHPEPRPSTLLVAARLCGPVILLLCLLIAAAFFRPSRNVVVWPLLFWWAMGAAYFATLHPLVAANRLARASEPRRTRRAAAGARYLQALLVNLSALIIAFLALLAIIRY